MLEIDIEFKKGVLLIRLKGVLNKDTVSKLKNEVVNLIIDNEITNIVFNVKDLVSIDIKGINSLLYVYELVNKYKGKSLLCNIDNTLVRHRIKNSRLLNYMYEASDELSAINIVNL